MIDRATVLRKAAGLISNEYPDTGEIGQVVTRLYEMSEESPSGVAAEISVILADYTATQRAAALAENTRVKVVLAKSLPGASAAGAGQLVFETVIDQDAPRAEIDGLLDRVSDAADRQEAKTMLEGHLRQLRMDEGLLARQKHDLARKELEFKNDNAQRNASRHIAVTLTAAQGASLAAIRTGIEESEAAILERRLSIGEARRIIKGQSRLDAVEETMRLRDGAAKPASAA